MAGKTGKTKGRSVLGNVFYILFLALVTMGGALAGWFAESEVGTSAIRQRIFNTPPQKVFGTSSQTLLILGCDQTRANNKSISEKRARSDMIMVARLDFDNVSIGAVSIPRDTLCQLPGYERQKINAYHEIGGPELTQQAVEHLLPGVVIDRTVVLDFETFQEIVDLLGGVEVYVTKDMDYDDNWGDLHIHLKKGRQTLNGYDAMGYVRFRKGSKGQSDSDFERQKRHREFMLAMKDKMIANWTSAPTILDKSVELTSNALSGEEIASLALFAQKVQKDNIRMGQIPVVDVPGTYNLAVSESELQETLEAFKVLYSASVSTRKG